MPSRHNTSHEWWKDHSDPTEKAAFTRSLRANEHERRVAGWRRNVMLVVLAVALPVLLHLLHRGGV